MTYSEALERLFALRRFGVRPGLEATRAALAAVGNPERAFAAIHVAGTNGKGSTAAFAERMLREAGVRTGLYTSPHLSRFTERIRVSGIELDEDETAELAARVLGVAPALTFFEVVTVMAFAAFRARGVEVAVIEAGLGGRLDATNVLEAPLAAVVTGVALDHTDVLGATLVEIAREKAGIFKPGAPAIFACADEGARAVLIDRARELGAPAEWPGHGFDFAPRDGGGMIFRRGDRALEVASLGLAGEHQRSNAALALAAIERVSPRIADEARARGLAETRWPGRLETVTDARGLLGGAHAGVLIDAAHNPDGARALAAALRQIAAGRPVTLIFGVVADKDAPAMLAALAPAADELVLTRPDSPRARDPESLRALAPNARVAPSLAEALALAAARARGPIVVAGSIFLVGEARRLLTGERADPLIVQDPMPEKL
ncbi:MAG TPA: folylpolyglutamate synthase/dihydrofolate synthase family protein [Polyangia bacterium]|nr:folylpolyglutamate synthase/dihydrofolate synthase family protein [Polyangia bacterium]